MAEVVRRRRKEGVEVAGVVSGSLATRFVEGVLKGVVGALGTAVALEEEEDEAWKRIWRVVRLDCGVVAKREVRGVVMVAVVVAVAVATWEVRLMAMLASLAPLVRCLLGVMAEKE